MTSSPTAPPAGPPRTNRLIHETSPYLLQHARNPVDWYPWGEEALQRARDENKPILLSIGYSACHWCHVMEHESFEDDRIAALMNESFVCVKVDREERPDLDEIYMAATQAMNAGQGGWPMTVFLTPDQKPFFAGTYFPPTDKHGRPGFGTLLARLAKLWREEREALETQAAHLSEELREQARPLAPLPVGVAELDAAAAQLARDFDPRHGGFGRAPKFPPSTGLSLLLRHHRRTGDEHALEMVRKTLGGMARGGMYDQIGGGFHRYSVDERWLVPHFEKMLYDNALLAKVYLETFQVTGERFYRRVAGEVLDYVLREMTSTEGGFTSATDADSEGEEGKFFVWTPAEIEAVLGSEEGRRFCAYYDITEAGNWEGKSIPNVRRTVDHVAKGLGIDAEELRRSLREARPKVYQARLQRVPPGLDDKVLTAWNGLMIGALATGAMVLGETRYLQAAERAATFLRTTLVSPDGGLLRTYRAGKAHLKGYLEDYAYLCEALIDLYEAGGAPDHLAEALRLAERMLAEFGDQEQGGFYSTARDHEELLLRHREGTDGATPSANATAAYALARLSFHFDREDLREAATRAIAAYGKMIARQPRAFAKGLAVVDFLLQGPVELAFLGQTGEPGFEALRREVARHYLPNRIVAHHDPGRDGPAAAFMEPPDARTGDGFSRLPLLAGKGLVGGSAALYVCRDFTCQAPITEPGDVASALAGAETAARGRATDTRSVIGSLLPGGATPGGTAAYASRHISELGPAAYVPLGSTGLTVSRVGFGGYRVHDEVPGHREALEQALARGVNVVDTSTNYTDGASERLIGAVLNDLVRRGTLRREELVLVSKIGYVQGSNLELARERERVGRPFPEMVKYLDEVWHCIHPEFLDDQLGRSLARLGVETLDVCLLHNPEYFLLDAKRRGDVVGDVTAQVGAFKTISPEAGSIETIRQEFHRRLREAFRFFEREVAAGRIRWYGVSSNTVAAPMTDPEATSLARMLRAAQEAGGEDHHFRVLQLPMNLFEAGAALEPKEGLVVEVTVLDYAAREGVGVLVNRPLNAVVGEGMLRLADVEVGGAPIDLEVQLKRVGELEDEYRRDVAPRLRIGEGGPPPEELFRWSAQLKGLEGSIQGLEQWEQVENFAILPHVSSVIAALDGAFDEDGAEGWRSWRDRYLVELERLIAELRRRAASKSQAASRAVAAALDPLLPLERRHETLARKALWVLAGTPGVSVVLNGMREPGYVGDAVEVLRWPALPDVFPIYRSVRALELPRAAARP